MSFKRRLRAFLAWFKPAPDPWAGKEWILRDIEVLETRRYLIQRTIDQRRKAHTNFAFERDALKRTTNELIRLELELANVMTATR